LPHYYKLAVLTRYASQFMGQAIRIPSGFKLYRVSIKDIFMKVVL